MLFLTTGFLLPCGSSSVAISKFHMPEFLAADLPPVSSSTVFHHITITYFAKLESKTQSASQDSSRHAEVNLGVTTEFGICLRHCLRPQPSRSTDFTDYIDRRSKVRAGKSSQQIYKIRLKRVIDRPDKSKRSDLCIRENLWLNLPAPACCSCPSVLPSYLLAHIVIVASVPSMALRVAESIPDLTGQTPLHLSRFGFPGFR